MSERKMSEQIIEDSDKLCKMAWELFCKLYPEQIKGISPEIIDQFKAAWTVGYYFSLNPYFKPIKQKISLMSSPAEF